MNAFRRTFPKYLAIAIDNARSFYYDRLVAEITSPRRNPQISAVINRHMLIFVSRLITSAARAKSKNIFHIIKVSQSLVKLALSGARIAEMKSWKTTRWRKRRRDNGRILFGHRRILFGCMSLVDVRRSLSLMPLHVPYVRTIVSPPISLESPTSNSTSFFGKRRPCVT